MALKKIINNKPEVGDISQYNFSDSETDFSYQNSTSLPENNDKFQDKDLFTNCVGDEVNEAIIEKNLKFEGNPYIKIENLYISNTGVDGTVKSNRVAAWIFSQEAYGGDPTTDGYSTLRDTLWNDDNESKWKFFDSGFGSKNEGTDIGNIENIEGTEIVSNFGVDSSELTVGDFDGSDMTVEDITDAFKLNPLESGIGDVAGPTQTSIFNESQPNPIYIVIYMRGHKKVFWPINTDERKRRYDIFKINTDDLFDFVDPNYFGKVYQTNFSSATKTRTGEGGGGAQQEAWKVTSLKLSINTSSGVNNKFSGVSNYKQFIPLVTPRSIVSENIFNSFLWLRSISPNIQLDNSQDSDYPNTNAGRGEYRHPDFIPFTTFGFSQNNDLATSYVDLQSYYENFDLIMKASSPLNVTFNIDVKGIDGEDILHYQSYDYLDLFDDEDDPSDFPIGAVGDQLFYYFIIDWNDTKDKFKTIEDWLESRPENNFDYLEKQNENLYKIRRINYTQGTNNGLLSNVYTTPGIKNIKFIMFSVFDGNGFNNYSPDFEIGRWKLCTSRIYLDIPPNQYPDFSDVGGTDYTTLPWPFTTPIIGGVSEDSRYKKSISNTLGGGRIGEFDIIDEKLLVNDLDNDEMGKNIETMDLEQCRYFNTGSYDIYKLLNINPVIDNELIPFNDSYYDGETNKFSEESSVGQIFINENQDNDLKENCKLELNTGELTGKSILDTSGNSNKGLLIGDYKVKKVKKGQSMRRDSFIKVPKKTGNTKGAL